MLKTFLLFLLHVMSYSFSAPLKCSLKIVYGVGGLYYSQHHPFPIDEHLGSSQGLLLLIMLERIFVHKSLFASQITVLRKP